MCSTRLSQHIKDAHDLFRRFDPLHVTPLQDIYSFESHLEEWTAWLPAPPAAGDRLAVSSLASLHFHPEADLEPTDDEQRSDKQIAVKEKVIRYYKLRVSEWSCRSVRQDETGGELDTLQTKSSPRHHSTK